MNITYKGIEAQIIFIDPLSPSISFKKPHKQTQQAFQEKDPRLFDLMTIVYTYAESFSLLIDICEWGFDNPFDEGLSEEALQASLQLQEQQLIPLLSLDKTITFEKDLEQIKLYDFVQQVLQYIQQKKAQAWKAYQLKKDQEQKREQQRQQRRKAQGYVYLLASKHGYKIGKTRRPSQRLTALPTLLPFETKRIFCQQYRDYHSIEHELHEHFQDKHLNGEWFELTAQDIAFVKSYKPELMVN